MAFLTDGWFGFHCRLTSPVCSLEPEVRVHGQSTNLKIFSAVFNRAANAPPPATALESFGNDVPTLAQPNWFVFGLTA